MISDILAEHALAAGLRQADLDSFRAEGIKALALARSCYGDYGFLARDRVVFEGSGRFELVRYIRDATDACNSYIMPALDEFAEPVDLAAFRPGGPAAVWLGRVAMLGQEQVLMPRFDEPLDVHDTVMDWLRADRNGIVLLDYRRAAARLDGVTLRVATPDHARRLRAALARPAPPVVVATASRAAA